MFTFAGAELSSEAISHWLNTNDGEGKGKERFLSIQAANTILSSGILKFEEVVEHLKEVNYIFYDLLN